MNNTKRWEWEGGSVEQDEHVCLDDGTDGFVEAVNLNGRLEWLGNLPIPKILVTRRKLGEVDMPDREYIPANIVG